MNDDFEWYIRKAASNWRDHSVSFEHAREAFKDLFAIEMIDDREAYGEERIILFGMCAGVILQVTYAMRGD